jgi:hypothetical protein
MPRGGWKAQLCKPRSADRIADHVRYSVAIRGPNQNVGVKLSDLAVRPCRSYLNIGSAVLIDFWFACQNILVGKQEAAAPIFEIGFFNSRTVFPSGF